MRFQKTIAATLVAASLTGCASAPPAVRDMPKGLATSEGAATDAMSAAWNNAAVERDGKAMLVLVTPFSVPQDVRAKQIRLELESGATVKDLIAVMANLGYSIILADTEAGEKQFYLPRYSGTLGGLLSAVARATDVWFTWNDGTIVVSAKEKVSVTLPQEETLGTRIAEGLKGLGVEDAASSWEAGMLTLAVTPTQLTKVRAFLQRMTNNAALVSLQVAILNVQMSQDAKQGVDWSKLQFAVGRDYAPSGIQVMDGFRPTSGNSSFQSATTGAAGATTGTTPAAATTPATSGTTTGGNTGTATTPTAALANTALTAIGLAGGGFKGVLTNSAFSFTGLYDFLQTYGVTETKQNVVLKTIAGTSVELKSLTQTPYVESIAVTSTGTSGTNGAGNTLGSAKTAKADDGITLKMTPTFDAAANTVTVKMDLALKAVLGFKDLSAGNQIGQLSQPTTAERSFNDVLRIRPGQTVVVGGITYDSVGDSGNSPTFAAKGSRLEHSELKVNRNSMFIVVRPTIATMGQVVDGEGNELFAPAKSVPEPVKAAPAVRPLKAAAEEKKAAVKPTKEVEKPTYDAEGYAAVPLRAKE